MAKLESEQFEMLIASPICGPFSALQGLNFSEMIPEEVEQVLRTGVNHLKFAMTLCKKQSDAGRLFMFEHPSNARSWSMELVKGMLALDNVVTVDFDFCQFGMNSEDAQAEGCAKKRTRVLTNFPKLAKRLSAAQCDDEHRHVSLTNFRAGPCQVYPVAFCDEICMAVKEELMTRQVGEKCQLIMNLVIALTRINDDMTTPSSFPSGLCKGCVDNVMSVDLNNVEGKFLHPHDDDFHHLYHGMEFFDDVHAEPLDNEMAIQARRLEMEFFCKMKVHSKVDRSVAKQIGAKIIPTKWIDTNKGDDDNPNYRARLVGREIKIDQRPDLFAATPPLEALRMIFSICASNQHGKDPYRILSSDIKRAYFFARAKGPIFIEIPIEDREPGDESKVGRLNLSLYGTRDAAMNWQDEFTSTLIANGFERGKASPCNFHHSARRLSVTVHGDDFTSTGPKGGLEWFQRFLDKVYECKHQWLGPDQDEEKSIRILNRVHIMVRVRDTL